VIGGGEYGAYLYARGLVHQGHDVHVVTSHPRHSAGMSQKEKNLKNLAIHETVEGIKVHRILGVKTIRIGPLDFSDICENELFHIQSALTLIGFLKETHPNIIHAMNVQSIPSAVVAGKICGIPVVATNNSLYLSCPRADRLYGQNSVCWRKCSFSYMADCVLTNPSLPVNMKGRLTQQSRFLLSFGLIRLYLKWSFLRLARLTDGMIAVSNHVKNLMIKQMNYDENKVTIIPELVDLSTFIPKNSRKDDRLKLGLSDEDKAILFLDPLFRPIKGSDVMLDALPTVLKSVPNAKLLIAGSVSPSKLEEIKHRNLLNNVVFAGLVPMQRLPDVYLTADVVAVPSVVADAFGRVPIEAMSLGKPVVASKIGGITDQVDGTNGILVKPNSSTDLAKALVSLLSDEDLRERLSKSGLETINKFSEITVIRSLVDFYQRILNNN
jgi:glycosyltransferase involved in cell wall biosynthesis